MTTAQLAETVHRSHATQQLIETVLRNGTPMRLNCPTCGRETEHRDRRIDGICYTVCRNCRSVTTSA